MTRIALKYDVVPRDPADDTSQPRIVIDLDKLPPGDREIAMRFFADQVERPEPEFVRASGLCVCQTCWKLYYNHPRHHEWRFLTVLCDGKLVKL